MGVVLNCIAAGLEVVVGVRSTLNQTRPISMYIMLNVVLNMCIYKYACTYIYIYIYRNPLHFTGIDIRKRRLVVLLLRGEGAAHRPGALLLKSKSAVRQVETSLSRYSVFLLRDICF